MTTQTIAEIMFNNIDKDRETDRKMTRLWKIIEQKRGFDFLFEVVQECTKIYEAKHGKI